MRRWRGSSFDLPQQFPVIVIELKTEPQTEPGQ